MRRGLFRRREHEVPELNLASLPDLIFTVLFFFMIVTHMRDVDLKVRYQVPQPTEVKKLGHKSSVCHIYVGQLQSSNDTTYYIQLNNKIATIDDIRDFVDEERARMSSEDQARMTVSIKADRNVPMSIISDIKHELQKAFALRINYSATEK